MIYTSVVLTLPVASLNFKSHRLGNAIKDKDDSNSAEKKTDSFTDYYQK